MAILENIKQRISALSSGNFQNLCDAYLNEIGYQDIVCLGSKSGTGKTTKGTPDTYCCLDSDGKYVFVEYTTQQNRIYDKMKSDLDKCFDESKTKIATANISTIFYFHTTSNLTPEQDSSLKQFCLAKGAKLNILGIDRLANEIYNNHKILAKDYLDIPISTEQILTKDEFIKKYDHSPTTASINTVFMFREKEMAEIDSAFSECNIVLLNGAAGVGKTRLAIEYAEKYSAANGSMFYCIRNNNLSIYDDLHLFFSKNERYVIIIDDANELGSLGNIIEFFREGAFDYKIIITVRNYALYTVKEIISPLEKYNEINVNTFSDEEITEFLEKELGIIKQEYIERIIRVSEGNARIAYLTGKVVSKTNDLSSIRDVTSVYSEYYGKHLKDNKITDNRMLACAGIVAFINVINLDHVDNIMPVLEISNITDSEFNDNLYKLHEYEIVNIYKDKVVRFSDQCLSNYILKYVFIDKKLISLSDITKSYFQINMGKTVNSINTILNCFNSDEVDNYVTSIIKTMWRELEEEHSPHFWEFVKAFYTYNTTSALILLNEKINAKESLIIPAEQIDINKKRLNNIDDILKILGGFSKANEINEALDLYFKFYLKCPQLYDQFHHIAISFFGINKENSLCDYNPTISFLEKLVENSENLTKEYIILLLLGIAPDYLNINFYVTESARKYRGIIWNSLLALADNEKYIFKIIKILNSYGSWIGSIQDNIVEFDSTKIKQILEKMYTQRKLETSILCIHINRIFDYANIEYNDFFDMFFSNPEFQMYMIFKGPNRKSGVKYKERRTNKIKIISDYIQNCDEIQIKKVIDIISRVHHSIERTWDFDDGLRIAFDVIIERKKYFVDVVQYYLQSDTPGNVLDSVRIVSQLFEKLDDVSVWNLICNCNYQSVELWQYAYFHELPEKYIDETHTKKLFDFLKKDSDKQVSSSPYRDVTFLHKYEKVYPNSFINGCKIIFAKKEYSPFIVSVYFEFLFNQYNNNPKYVIALFDKDYQLLEDIYLFSLKYDKMTDYDGEFLKEFYIVNPKILAYFLNEKAEKYSIDEGERIYNLFTLDNYIEIFDSVMNDLIKMSDNNSYLYHSFVEVLLSFSNETLIQERQSKWLEHYIKENSTNLIGTKMVFRVITNYNDDRKLNYMRIFLENNQDYDSFEQLPILPDSHSWTGSYVPIILREIDYLKKLLVFFTGISWIRHKKHIEDLIENKKKEIEWVDIHENMYGF